MIDLLKDKQPEIAALCQHYRIRKLEVFGSAATGAFNPESSDIDFLIDLGGYEPGVSGRFFDFADAMEELLGYRVELVTEDSIRNPYFRRSVNRSRALIYERGTREAVA